MDVAENAPLQLSPPPQQEQEEGEEEEEVPTKRIELRVESGGFANMVYWRVHIWELKDGNTSITVKRQEPLGLQAPQVFKGKLSKAAARKLWKAAKEQSVWGLPKTNYKEDLCDDCYHLGVSVEVHHQELGRYVHQIPVGCCVVVAPVNPNKDEIQRFLSFIRAVAQAAEQASNIPIPDHVRLRWESRLKELALLNMLVGA
ncbi:hypothetical protein QOT17_006116 [Balamuthia mandrillaris]